MPDNAPDLEGSPVVPKLMAVLEATESAFALLHNQEHYWELAEYPKLEDWWDEANRDVWCIHHRILKRVFKLGGRPTGVQEDEVKAFEAALDAFYGIHAACREVYDVADEVDDYVTIGKLQKLQATVESWIVDARMRLAQINKLKPPTSPFMSEQI